MKSILSRDVIEAHKNTKEAAAWRKSRTEYYEALGRYVLHAAVPQPTVKGAFAANGKGIRI